MKTAKRILDVVMTLALPCLMAYELIGQETHEMLGLCVVGLFILHHLLNLNWHKNLFRGKYTAFRMALTVMDCLMIVIFIDQAVTGVMMAKHVFPALPHVGRRSSARILHLLGCYWGFAICGLHAGMHMTGALRKWRRKPRSVGKAVPAVFLCGAAAYGVYAFAKRGLYRYMFLLEQFVFFDFDEPVILYLADFAAMISLFMLLGSLLGCALQTTRRRRNLI